jgi:thiamine pyrophosphokinase
MAGDFPRKKWLIIANGEAKFSNREALVSQMEGCHSIALDGAAHLLSSLSLGADLLMGDFDSIGEEMLARWRGAGIPCIYRSDQESTDMEKALQFALANGAEEIRIIHGLGGRLDHALANVFFLKKYSRMGVRIVLLDEGQCMEYFADETVTLRGRSGGYCGFFAMPSAHVTSRGLKYEMDDLRLRLGRRESVANQFLGAGAEISVRGACIGTYETPTLRP